MSSLLSIITTLYALQLLYSPPIVSRFILSPVLLSTLILLLYLLQLGADQRCTIKRAESHTDSVELNSAQSVLHRTEDFRDHKRDSDESSTVVECRHCRSYGPDPKQNSNDFHPESFVEWDVRAPLEVIYEEYEGEDAEENDSQAKRESLSLYYPDSDSDASSEGEFPANRVWDSVESTWEEEDDREGLIEIALDGKRHSEVDEENLIEIDLSPGGVMTPQDY